MYSAEPVLRRAQEEDLVSRGFFLGLGHEGQQSLVDIIAGMWACITPATQTICIVIAFILNGATTWRHVALLHMIYRWLANMLRPQLIGWEAQNSGP